MSSPLWIFGYGSLLWDPGLPAEQCARGLGWHRSFSMRSIHYRGTCKTPAWCWRWISARAPSVTDCDAGGAGAGDEGWPCCARELISDAIWNDA